MNVRKRFRRNFQLLLHIFFVKTNDNRQLKPFTHFSMDRLSELFYLFSQSQFLLKKEKLILT